MKGNGAPEPPIHGSVAPGFERVRDVFRENFTKRKDKGAAFAAYRSGKEIIHLWGGEAGQGQPWKENTLVCGFSTGKGITALAIQMLVDRGSLDLEAPVGDVWSEFAGAGKTGVTPRMILNHTAGLPAFAGYEAIVNTDEPETFQRHDAIAASLASASPLWEPGKYSGYHSMTMGFLLGEIVRRVTGQTIGEYIRDEIARPLGLDYWVGLPPKEHYRVATLQADPEFGSDETYKEMNSTTLGGQSLFMGAARRLDAVFGQSFNDPAFRVAEVAAAGPHTDARSLARIYGALADDGSVDGVRLLSDAMIAKFAEETFNGTDVISKLHSRLGLGYALNSELRYAMGPNEGSFGHPGYGGAMAFADPVSGLGFGYVTNQLLVGMGTDDRVKALIDTAFDCMASE